MTEHEEMIFIFNCIQITELTYAKKSFYISVSPFFNKEFMGRAPKSTECDSVFIDIYAV